MTDVVENIITKFSDRNQTAMDTLAETIANGFKGFHKILTKQQDMLIKNISSNTYRNAEESADNIASQQSGSIPVDIANSSSSPPADRNTGLPVDQQVGENEETRGARVREQDEHSSSYSGSKLQDDNDEDSLSIHPRGKSLSTPTKSSKRSRSRTASRDSGSSSKISKKGEKAPVVEEDIQVFWAKQVDLYNTDQEEGPEVNSSLAGTCKVFWTKVLFTQKLENLAKSSKMPNNCQFLKVQLANKEIFTTTSGDIRAKDVAIQELQKTYGQMSSNIIQAADSLYSLKENFAKISNDMAERFQPTMEKLKDALILAGKLSMDLNNHRRNLFKPSIPASLKTIVDEPSHDSDWSFGDNLKERLAKINGDDSIRQEFVQKKAYSSYSFGSKSSYEKNVNANRNERKSYSSENYRGPRKFPGGSNRGHHQQSSS